MKFALSTNWCNRRIISGEEIADKALALGFDSLELGYRTTDEQAKGFVRRLDEMPVGSVHAFAPVPISAPMLNPEIYSLASFNAEMSATARIHALRSARLAADLGADAVVVHAGRASLAGLFDFIGTARLDAVLDKNGGERRSRAYMKTLSLACRRRRERGARLMERFRRILDDLLPEFERLHVTLACENMPYLEGFPNEAEMDCLLKAYAGAPIGAWFDTGHHRVRVCHGWVREDERPTECVGMHLNDVIALEDDHFAPGGGRVDFAALAPLAKSARHLVFEPNDGVSEKDLVCGLEKMRSLWKEDAT